MLNKTPSRSSPSTIRTQQTAHFLAERQVPTASPEDSARGALAQLQALANTYTSIDYVYVLSDRTLVGVISLHELMQANPIATIGSVMTTPVKYVHTTTDQEQVAELALAENIKAVPVIDSNHSFVGMVSADTILRILREEHTEDILKLAGLVVSDTPFKKLSNVQHIISRLPWLLLGLGGGFLAAVIIESFSEIIESHLLLAAFIPAIVYLADAVGSQTQMVYIRSLTIGLDRSLRATLIQEGVVATGLGTILATLTWLLTWWWYGELIVSHIVAIAILGTVYFSICIGVLLPWIFDRVGADPAVASGPLATVVRDVLSLSIYLLIAGLLI